MSKKKSSSASSMKKLSQAGDKPSLQQKKPGKLGKEIDDIFGGGKTKKPSSQAGVVKPSTVKQTKPGKIGKEIDDIFGGRKKKLEVETSEKKESPVKKAGMVAKRKRKRTDLDGGFNNSNPKKGPRKRTEDGLLVFTEDELGINKANAGNTPLCPFDCNCCF